MIILPRLQSVGEVYTAVCGETSKLNAPRKKSEHQQSRSSSHQPSLDSVPTSAKPTRLLKPVFQFLDCILHCTLRLTNLGLSFHPLLSSEALFYIPKVCTIQATYVELMQGAAPSTRGGG